MSHCVVIPTYNNASTLVEVVAQVFAVCANVIVVNDGSTDSTSQLLQSFPVPDQCRFWVVEYSKNRGKGYALKCGFSKAKAEGFDCAVTIDADGQHYAADICRLVDAYRLCGVSRAMVVGSRDLAADGMPAQNSFANRFSNFWFRLQTGVSLPDTQTGFRLYSLRHLPCMGLLTNRYESELELLVFSSWNGVKMISCPVRVYYPPAAERVSHSRPFWDFFRISVLNTVLCILCLVYGYWSMLSYRYRLRYRHL